MAYRLCMIGARACEIMFGCIHVCTPDPQADPLVAPETSTALLFYIPCRKSPMIISTPVFHTIKLHPLNISSGTCMPYFTVVVH